MAGQATVKQAATHEQQGGLGDGARQQATHEQKSAKGGGNKGFDLADVLFGSVLIFRHKKWDWWLPTLFAGSPVNGFVQSQASCPGATSQV